MFHYLISFNGRINRAKLWAWAAACAAIALGCMFVTIHWPNFHWPHLLDARFLPFQDVTLVMALPLPWVLYFLLLWPTAALAVKRLHDREKSAAWLIVFWGIPFAVQSIFLGQLSFGEEPLNAYLNGLEATLPQFIGGGQPLLAALVRAGLLIAAFAATLWGFVELYWLSGTIGENRYGSDPLGGPRNITQVFPGRHA